MNWNILMIFILAMNVNTQKTELKAEAVPNQMFANLILPDFTFTEKSDMVKHSYQLSL